MRVRRLKQCEFGLAFALAGMLVSRSTFAIGLGEIQKQSALGAPLNVEIELSLDGGESIESIHTKIADASAYDQAGLQRQSVLEHTSVDAIQHDGHTFLHVFSTSRVAEPYLPLLLEVGDARGKLLREYDLLLDPPSSKSSEPSGNPSANPIPLPAAAAAVAKPPLDVSPAVTTATIPDAANGRAAAQRSNRADGSSRHLQKSGTPPLESKPLKKSGSPARPDADVGAAEGFARVVLNVPIAGPIATPSPRLALTQSLGNPPTAAESAAVGARLVNGAANPQNPAVNPPAGTAVAIGNNEKDSAGTAEMSSSEAQNALGQTSTQPGTSHGFFYGVLALIAGALWIVLLRRRWNNAPPPETLEPKTPRAYTRATNVIPPMDVLDGQPTAESVAASVRAFEARSAAAKQEELQSVGSDFFDNVAEFLQQAVTREPHRFDLRMKLLEVYYAAGNVYGFVEQARDYRQQARDAISDKQWPEIARMGRELAAGDELFAEPVETSRPLTSMVGARETVTLLHHRRYYEELDSARLEPLLNQLAAVHADAANDEGFKKLVQDDLREFMQRPSALQHAARLSVRCGGAAIYLKRTDLHGARDPELINAIGQINLALCMGKKQVLAGTLRSGNHAVAVATVAVKKGLRCRIFISETALEQAKDKLTKLRELGAEVQVVWPEDEHPVDPRRAAMQAWMNEPQSSLFISSLSAGPRPYPAIVLDFQTTVGQEVLRQLAEEPKPRYPDALIVDAGGGFETFGLFAPFLGQKAVRLYSAKAINAPVETVVSEGAIVRQQHWQSLGRERAWLRETGRVAVRPTTYEDALAAVEILARLDGYNISIEDGYAVACATDIAASLPMGKTVVALLGASRE
jgi:tryptophan synthase beta chain